MAAQARLHTSVLVVLLFASLLVNFWQYYAQHFATTAAAPSPESPPAKREKPRVFLSESALIWLQQEDYGLAIAAMDQLQENSQWQAAELQLAWSQELTDRLNDGHHEFVERALNALLDAYPYNEDFLLTQALLLERQNQWAEASTAYYGLAESLAADERSNMVAKAEQLALVAVDEFIEQAQWLQALEYLDELLWREPENSAFLVKLIQVHLHQKNLDQAELHLARLQQLPNSQRLVDELKDNIQQIQQPDATQMVLRKYNKHLLVPIRADASDLQLLLDTGASLSVINRQSLSLLPGATYVRATRMNTAGGQVLAEIYRVEQVTLGPYELRDVEFAVLDLTGLAADGLLGMNVLRQFTFAIDSDAGTLDLAPKTL